MCPWSQLEGKSTSHVWAQKLEGLLKVNKTNFISTNPIAHLFFHSI